MKTRQEILEQSYVNISDIKALLMLPKDKAKLIFEEIDKEESKKQFRAHENKVPLNKVLKLLEINYSFLEKQIKK